MDTSRAWYLCAAGLALALLLTAAPEHLPAQQAAEVAIDGDDIGGVVRGPGGPEAGVWVIAETTPWLMEGGKGSKPRAVHIRVRPDPLAK